MVVNSKEKDSYCNDKPSFDMLSNEILALILGMVIKSSKLAWPDHVYTVVKRLLGVSSRFQQCVDDVIRSKLPRLHMPNGESGLKSVCSLKKKFGPYSGLFIAVKEIIGHPLSETVLGFF